MTNTTEPHGLTLAICVLNLRCGRYEGDYRCRISFDLQRTDTLLIESLESVAGSFAACAYSDSFFVSAPFIDAPIECFVNIASWNSRGDLQIKLIPRRSRIKVNHGRPLVRVRSGVLNLGHYYGHERGFLRNQFSLIDGGWHLDFTPAVETILQYPPAIQDSMYFFTHHLEMTKCDGATFSAVEAEKELDLVCSFLSFCHGYWVSTALAYGLAEDGTVAMEEWGTRKVSPWHSGTNWLDKCHGHCMVELFPLFGRRMEDPDWREAIEHSIYWSVRSETSFVGPDGGCVLLQATLERLAWQALVIENVLSENGFARLKAAGQLRRLLSICSIPLDIPPHLSSLRHLANEMKWADGPEAFVEIRNRIIHPPKTKNGKQKGWPYYEAYVLGKWYLELIILGVCGYRGVYANRTKIQRWVGDVERVPWAAGVNSGVS